MIKWLAGIRGFQPYAFAHCSGHDRAKLLMMLTMRLDEWVFSQNSVCAKIQPVAVPQKWQSASPKFNEI